MDHQRKRKTRDEESRDTKRIKDDDFEVVSGKGTLKNEQIDQSNIASFVDDLIKGKSSKKRESKESYSKTVEKPKKSFVDVKTEISNEKEALIKTETAEEKTSRTVHVSGITDEITESVLQKKFKKFGKIEDIRFAREKNCAWIQYENKSSSDSAAKNDSIQLNGVDLGVEKARWKEKVEVNDAATVFVRNLNFETTEDTLREFFGDIGEVTWVRIPKFHDTGKARGVAYISFAEESLVNVAISKSGQIIDGRTITVEKSDREQKSKPLSSKYGNTIFVGGLARTLDEEKIRKHFKKFGKITNLRMPLDEKGVGKGFVFIEYENESAIEPALKDSGIMLEGKKIRIDNGSRDMSQEKPNYGASKRVYVRNMNFLTDDKKLREFFAECGEITSIEIPVFEDSGKSRGIAYIEFATEEGASQALNYDCSKLDGRTVNVASSKK
jgi:RNA recognition motif-containing protein